METPIKRLQELKRKLADISADLQSLERLLVVDVPSSLNKIRFITEKVLYKLCRSRGLSWGQAEPTLERMIGPLVAAGAIPKDISLHVRTIQNYASPGSHFQASALSISHVHIAQSALVEFLAWYYENYPPAAGEPETFPPPPAPPPIPETISGTIEQAAWRRTSPGIIECSGNIQGATPEVHIWLAVEIGELLWPKEPEIQPGAEGAWSGRYHEGGTCPRLNLGLWVVDADVNHQFYEWLESGRRTGSYPGLRPIPGMRRIGGFEGLELT